MSVTAPETPPLLDPIGVEDGRPTRWRTFERRVRGTAGYGWRPIAGCLVAYAALALLVFFPIGPFDTRHLPLAGAGNPGGNDPFQMTWFLAYVPYALTHGLSLFHTNYIDYPTGVNLADNTSVPLLGILGWPITATLGPVAAFNFLLRLSFALSGASMFLVLRRWCRTWQAPFVGGLLYAFGPYMTSQELHLDLTFVPIPPILVLLGDELVRRQKMSPWLLGGLVGVLCTAQYLTSPDVLSGCVAMAFIVGVGLALRFRHQVVSRLRYVVKAAVVAAGSFALLGAYPLYEMMFGPGKIGGPVVQVGLLQSARADLLGAIAPTSNQLLVPPFVSFIGDYFVGGNLSENGTYIGIPLLIVLCLIAKRSRRDAVVNVMIFGAAAAWVLSLGAHLQVGTWPSPLPLPGDVLAHLPLFDNTIPARYALYVDLFAAIAVAIGFERLWLPALSGLGGTGPVVMRLQRVGDKGRYLLGELRPRRLTARLRTRGTRSGALRRRLSTTRAKLLMGTGVVVLSLIPNVPFASHGVPWPSGLPGTLESAVPRGAVVLTVPFATPGSSEAMSWAAIDDMGFRIIGGYANIADPGTAHGLRQPPPLPPTHVQTVLGLPKLGTLMPWVPPATAQQQLLTYLKRYDVGAIAFSAMGADTSQAYWYLIDTLGQPEILRPGYAVWLPTDGRWPSHALG